MNPIVEEYKKCYSSYIYLIENYFKTFDASNRKELPFKLFPRQKVFLKALDDYNEVIAVKHRQAGISTISAAWIAGRCGFASKDSPETILVLANQKGMAQEFLEKIVYFIDQIPRWVWGKDWYSPNKDDPKNTKSIYIKKNQSEFLLFNGCRAYARSSKKGATRGISAVSILALDEGAHFSDDGPEVYSAAVACQSSVRNPKTIMISTPNGKDQLYYKLYSQAVSGLNNYHIVEFKWYQDPRYNRFLSWYKIDSETGEKKIFKESTLDKLGNITYDEEHWAQMVKDEWIPTSPWYESMCKKFGNDEVMINQELNVSFIGSSNNVVNPEVVEFQRDTNVIKITDNWELKDLMEPSTWIWKDPIPEHRYIIAADVSTGSSDDATAIEVIDCDAVDETTGFPYYEQVLEYNGKIIGDEAAELINKYGRAYGNALAVVDCIGGYGDACVLGLEARKYPAIYREDPNLKDYTLGDTVNKRKVKAEDERLPGFRTNAVRTQMLDKLRERLTDNSFRVRSMRVINELDTWVWKNGRPDHMSGFHDDTLTCLAMALFIMEFYMFRKLKNASKDAVMLRSWRSSKSFLTSEDINGAQPKNSLNIAEQKPKYKMPFYSSGARERQIQKRTMAMLMLGGFKPKNF